MKRWMAVLLTGTLTFAMAGCGQTGSSDVQEAGENVSEVSEMESQPIKIGVAVYDLKDDEVSMFRSYYQTYLEQAFEVEFVYSQALLGLDDEKSFVDEAKEAGCQGIISFVAADLPAIVEYCGDDMYYISASTGQSDESFEGAAKFDNYLGIYGPSSEEEYQAGVTLVDTLYDEDTKEWMILSGGAGIGNHMHEERLRGMLDTLVEKGYALTNTTEQLIAAETTEVAAESADGDKVYICPGYYYADDSEVQNALTLGEPDAFISVASLSSLYKTLGEKEEQQNKNIKLGTVDCFSDTNKKAFSSEDAFGNTVVDCVVGKCQAMAAPGFVAMYNALTGYEELVKDQGKAFRLTQGFWTADTKESYDEMMEQANNIYDNVYSTDSIMKVLGVYNQNATFEDFKAFVESL